MKTIKWKNKTQFLGRNGQFNCEGVGVTGFDHRGTWAGWDKEFPGCEGRTIRIYPITSKGDIGRGFVELPADFKTIEQLKQALDYEIARIEVEAEERGKAA